jgi:hypothetical protein
MSNETKKNNSEVDENEVMHINNHKTKIESVHYDNAFSWLYRRVRSDILTIFEFLLICLIMLLAVTAIYNISARETLSKSIETKIHTLNSEFVSSNKQTLSGKIPLDSISDLPKQVAEIARLEELSSEIQALKAYGGSFNSNLGTIKLAFTFSDDKQRYLENYPYLGVFSDILSALLVLSSDLLLALALLSCGALGSVIASLRSNSSVKLSKFTVGFTTGFITYLAIKGGQFVFLLQVPGASAVLNPYTASFVGLLSGMFSERFHLVLASFMDKATDKLKKSSSEIN